MIIPAILEKKLPALRKKLKLANTFSKVAHIDIMDGRFVPNRTIPPSDLKNAKTKLSVTIHLMSYYPEMYLHDLKDAGVKRVLVHVESTSKLAEVLMTGRSMGLQMGVVLNPRTSIKRVKPVSHLIKEVLVMSVQPGFSGQRFRPSALIKIKKLSKLYSDVKISVDGGITTTNVGKAKKAGADIIYASSSIWKKKDIKSAYNALKA